MTSTCKKSEPILEASLSAEKGNFAGDTGSVDAVLKRIPGSSGQPACTWRGLSNFDIEIHPPPEENIRGTVGPGPAR